MMTNAMKKTDIQIVRHEVGSESRWQTSLEQTRQLRQVILDRQPQPSDAKDLLDCDLRSAAIISRLAESSLQMVDCIALGAGDAAAAALNQTREYAGYRGDILLNTPDCQTRTIPVGRTSFGFVQWLNGFSLAACARDEDALAILCNPLCLKACEEKTDVMDSFWGFVCAAMASLVTAPAAARQFAQDTYKVLTSARITDQALIDQRIRPLLDLQIAITESSQKQFTHCLWSSLEAHRQYFTRQDQQFEQDGFLAFWILGLVSIAMDNGLDLEVSSDYLPEIIVRGPFTGVLSSCSYYYPDRCIFSAQEAHWFFDLEGFPRAHRKHKLIEQGELLVARYEVHGAPGLPHAVADFVILDSPNDYAPEDMPPPALDAGELLYLAEIYAGGNESFHAREQQQEYRDLLAEAIACSDAALSRVPDGRKEVTAESLVSVLGRNMYRDEPGRFGLHRMRAYRQALAQALQELDQKLAGQAPEMQTSQWQKDTQAREAGVFTSEAHQVADFSIEIIRSQVMPILERIATDKDGKYIAQLQPADADYARVFNGETVIRARQAYEETWRKGLHMTLPDKSQSEIDCQISPAGMLATDNPLSHHFPGGYRSIATQLNPHCVWVAWKYVQPGEASGLSFDGLVWVEDHWAWFPKPYRYLRDKVE